MRVRLTAHIAALAAWMVLAPAALCETGAQSAPQWDRYRVIFEKSVFSRSRSYSRRDAPVAAPAYRPERGIRLTGVVREGDRYIAFVEGSGLTSRLGLGDGVARGRIAGIALDHILYEADGGSWRVEMGQTLDASMPAPEGGVTFEQASVESSAPAESQPEAGPQAEDAQPRQAEQPPSAAPAGEGADSILERMRQRRQRELGR